MWLRIEGKADISDVWPLLLLCTLRSIVSEAEFVRICHHNRRSGIASRLGLSILTGRCGRLGILILYKIFFVAGEELAEIGTSWPDTAKC